MGDGLFGISITGLRAAQIGLSTTGHNITNASTPGFHRQEIIQSTTTPLRTGAGYIGQGVNVDTVRRVYSEYLDNQVKTAQTRSSYLDTYYAEISQIDNMLANPDSGLISCLAGVLFRGERCGRPSGIRSFPAKHAQFVRCTGGAFSVAEPAFR